MVALGWLLLGSDGWMVGRYATEAAMYPVIRAYLAGMGYIVMPQMHYRSAHADFMAFEVDWSQVERRRCLGPARSFTESTQLRLLLTIRGQNGVGVSELATLLSLSPSYVRRMISELAAEQVVVLRDGRVFSRYCPELLYNRIVVVEAKLDDWKRAVVQANRYSFCAEERYIALPDNRAARLAAAPPDLVQRLGMGILSVGSSVSVVVPARRMHTRQPTVEHFKLSERLWEVLANAATGQKLKPTLAATGE